ncbi:MAG TPA: alanine racemase [Acidimicrobiales bacterium]|nr:alanine racemase [Acidimicrobiales bacterium]
MTTISTSPHSFASDDVAARLAVIRQRIVDSGGDPAVVRVIAVTKGFGPAAVEAARAAGLSEIGENYGPELLGKAPGPPGTNWHFLGAIQRNKVRSLAPVVALWQGVARLVEGERIAQCQPGAHVLVQVDLTGLPGRNGCTAPEVPGLVEALSTLDLHVRGLMTVAPPDPVAGAAAFAAVARLADELGLPERSMGMSDDLEAAVAAGSTMIRIGRALFGPRSPREQG